MSGISMGYYKADDAIIIEEPVLLSRYGAGLFVYNGYLYIFGGYGAGGYLTNMEKIALNLSGASQVNLGNIVPMYVYGSTWGQSASSGKGYAIGGGNTGYGTNQAAEFDFSTETWTTVTGPGTLYKGGGSFCTDNSQYIYTACGIRTGSSGYLNENFRYTMGSSTYTTLAPCPRAQNVTNAATAYDSVNGRYYVCEGNHSGAVMDHNLYEYTIGTNTWATKAAHPFSPAQFGSAMAYYNGRIFMAGGHLANATTSTADIWVYTVASNSWSKSATSISFPRTYLVSITNGSDWYIVGGYNYAGGATYPNIDKLNMNLL